YTVKPFGRDGNSRKQFVRHAKVVGKRIGKLEVWIRIRERDLAEILRHLSEIDFASRCEIDTSGLAVRNVIVGKIGPGSGSLHVARVCGIIEICNVCRGSRIRAVKIEADGSYCIAALVIDTGGPR